MTIEPVDLRDQRALALVQSQRARFREVSAGRYLVPSQTRAGSYYVDSQIGECTCPDHAEHGTKCKHVRAVLLILAEVEVATAVVPEVKRKTYGQNWPAYRRSRQNEKDVFQRLLASLCSGIEQPVYAGDGRPRLPLSDVIFSAGVRCYTGMSADLATSDIRAAREKGYVGIIPHPNTVLRVLRSPETVPILRRLIEESTAPLRQVETKFAPDSTGFSTCTYVRWFDRKWGRDRRQKQWLKLHMMIGVQTQIITAAEVTPDNCADNPQFESLLDATAKHFSMSEVFADKGYLAHKAFSLVEKRGATLYVPFKPNSSGRTKDPIWNRMHAMFTLHEPEWRKHYHHRSLAESTFSMIKRVLGPSTSAKTYAGQVAEVYLKVLTHNVRMLVQSIFELGIDPSFWEQSVEGEGKPS